MADGDVGCLLHIFVVLCAVLSFNGCFYQSILSLLLFMGIYVVLGISFEHLEHVLCGLFASVGPKNDLSFSMPSYFTFCLFGVLSMYQTNWLTAFC
ncbi:YrvL family regulatory protein [Bacillus sp. SL00103]